MNSDYIPFMVVLPMAAAVLLNLLHGRRAALAVAVAGLGFAFILLPFLVAYGTHYFGGWTRDGATGLAVGIIYMFGSYQRLLIVFLALVAYFAAIAHLNFEGRISGVYLGFLMLGLGTCTAVLLTDDLFNLYVFLEITLISQTALVVSTGTERAWKAAVKYLIIANVAGNCLLLGIALLLSLVGSLNIADMQSYVVANGAPLLKSPVFLLACALITIAWSYASGLFPFHNIKAEMYSQARPHAAGLMQAQTKFMLVAVGLVILRLFGGVPHLRELVLYVAMGAMVFGVIMALRQDNYQHMLGYHAISQAGYVAAGLSIGTPAAVAAGIFHALNNALYKTALFIGSECVQRRGKTGEFRLLGGLMPVMPVIAILILVAKLAISGVPPFNGFQSKLMLMVSAFDAGLPEVTVIMLLVSVLTFISMMKAYHMVFLRPPETPVEPGEEAPNSYTITLIVLVGLCVLLGFYPEVALGYIQEVAWRTGLGWN